jgi:hypothetical protein
MRSPIALISLLALVLVLPLAVLFALSCDDAEGMAKMYENPTWPCRPDAIAVEGPELPADSGLPDSRLCWQKCQVHQTWIEEGESGSCIDENVSEPNWGKIQDLTIARERCQNEGYHTPSYEYLLTMLENCEDVGLDYGADGGPTDDPDAAVVHVTQYACDSCNQSPVCAETFVEQMHGAVYWSETRCPKSNDNVIGDPNEDWRGRWVLDFGTGESDCRRSTDEFSSLCVTEAPDPYPPMW